MEEYKKALFIFRRDLRLDDNTGLIEASTRSRLVIPCFIFDPEQIGPHNRYKSMNALQFMIESLEDLGAQLKKYHGRLYIFYGNPAAVVANIIKQEKIDAVFINRDYTPYSNQRDQKLSQTCKKHSVPFLTYDDALLNAPATVLKKDQSPYTMFTPYFKKSVIVPIAKPQKNIMHNYFTKPINEAESSSALKDLISHPNAHIFARGGSANAYTILSSLERYKHYAKERDIPALEATTGLSAHLKFGTCSARQAYDALKTTLGLGDSLVRQLYWRDFFTSIAYHFPHVFGHAFHKKYDALNWSNNESRFKAWCNGTTGFPLVDAGMRQLNATGFMHNRVRMVVASFLVKDLHLDWRWGERYFAQHLVDYDPAVNNGNWQWAASTGCDAQPYFRIFNPWLQQKKFDPNAIYIKRWIPELCTLSTREIHQWFKYCTKISLNSYPHPMVDHATESRRAKIAYKKASS